MKTLDLTVVIPLYNKEREIVRCISSILEQQVLPSNILIVDNNSNDNSLTNVRRFLNSVNVPIEIETVNCAHQGAGAARNYGVSLAKTKFVGFIDADDFYIGDVFHELNTMQCERNSDCYVFGYVDYQAAIGFGKSRNIRRKKLYLKSRDRFWFEYFWNRGFVCSSNIFIRREIFKSSRFGSGSFEEDLVFWEAICGSSFYHNPKSYIAIDKLPASGNSNTRVINKVSNFKVHLNEPLSWLFLCKLRRMLYRKISIFTYKSARTMFYFSVTAFLEMVRRFILRVMNHVSLV